MRWCITVVSILVFAGGCRSPLWQAGDDNALISAVDTALGVDPAILEAAAEGPSPASPDAPSEEPPDAAPVGEEGEGNPNADTSGGVPAAVAGPALGPELLPSPATASADWSAAGEALQPMSVDDVLEYALDHHPVLCERSEEIDIARARLVTAGLLPNPQLVLDTESSVHEGDATELMTRIAFTIPGGGKIRRKKAVAEAGIRRAQAALSRETELVLLEAAEAAIEVLYLQELDVLNTRYREEAADRAKVAEAVRVYDPQRKELRLADRMEANVDSMLADIEAIDTRTRLTVARLRLASAIGMPAGALVEVQGSLAVDSDRALAPLESVLAAAEGRRPATMEARAELTESQRLHVLAHAEAKADLEMAPFYQDRLGENRDRIGVRLNTDLPVFDKNQGGILETAALVRARRAGVEVAQLASGGEVVAAYMELRSIHVGVAAYEDRIVQLLERYSALVRDPQVRRSIGALQATEIQQELLSLQKKHLDLRYRYHQLLARLAVFLGQPIATTRAAEPDVPAPDGLQGS